MDETIIQRFYKLYDRPVPQILCLCIHELEAVSVTLQVPTLFDLLIRSQIKTKKSFKETGYTTASAFGGKHFVLHL
jgi:3-oxoacyl-[acyl-carrier-protein] synthase-3